VDYRGLEKSRNVVILRSVDVEHYKKILLTSIGHAPTSVVGLHNK
jgi:hypothetical protein